MIQLIPTLILILLALEAFSQKRDQVTLMKEFVKNDSNFIEYSNKYSQGKKNLKINSLPYSICSSIFSWREYFSPSTLKKCENGDWVNIESSNIKGVAQLSDDESFATLSFSEKMYPCEQVRVLESI